MFKKMDFSLALLLIHNICTKCSGLNNSIDPIVCGFSFENVS